MTTPGQRAHAVFGTPHYRVLADMLNGVEDEVLRRQMADIMATYFRKRYPNGFDPGDWQRLTGGRVVGFNIRTGKFDGGRRARD